LNESVLLKENAIDVQKNEAEEREKHIKKLEGEYEELKEK
jgi:hypothetical protein